MTAYTIPNLRYSAEAAADIGANLFVSIDSAGKAIAANATSHVVGATDDDTKQGNAAAIQDGIVLVLAGADITSGAAVESNADGKAVPFADATAPKAGIALVGGTSGQLVSIKI